MEENDIKQFIQKKKKEIKKNKILCIIAEIFYTLNEIIFNMIDLIVIFWVAVNMSNYNYNYDYVYRILILAIIVCFIFVLITFLIIRFVEYIKNKNNRNILDVLISGKKFPVIEFDKNEPKEIIISDYSNILTHHLAFNSLNTKAIDFFFDLNKKKNNYVDYIDANECREIERINILNRNVDIAVYQKKIPINVKRIKYYRANRYYKVAFTKTDLIYRFHISSKRLSKRKVNFFEKGFIQREEELEKYDSKYFESIKNKLSIEFYFKNFIENKSFFYLQIPDNIKEELLYLLNSYNINFTISIKDGLLAIVTYCEEKSLINDIELANNMDELIVELLKIFEKIEKSYKI